MILKCENTKNISKTALCTGNVHINGTKMSSGKCLFWSFLRKMFLQKAPSQIFDSVLNTSLACRFSELIVLKIFEKFPGKRFCQNPYKQEDSKEHVSLGIFQDLGKIIFQKHPYNNFLLLKFHKFIFVYCKCNSLRK